MSKKILLIVGIILILAVAAFFIFRGQPQNGEEGFGFSFGDFLPFGSSGNIGSEAVVDTTPKKEEKPNQAVSGVVPKLRKISSGPVAGAAIFNIGSTTYVRFVEKGTGNVYEARSDSSEVKRLTNTTIPKIIRAFWLGDGSGFLAQTLVPDTEIIETTFVKLGKNTATSSTESLTPFTTTLSKLPTGIAELSIRPDGTKIFYYTLSQNGSNWYTSNPDGTGATLVNNHPLSEWLPAWVSNNLITMQTKASIGVTSHLYHFDPTTKILKKTGAQATGLSTKPKDSNITLLSRGGSIPSLFVWNSKENKTTDSTRSGLAEKCVWSAKESVSVYCGIPENLDQATYPDSWYKGLANTEDSIRKIDLNNLTDYTISYLSDESGQRIDVIDLQISKDETQLVFKNKIDGYLWLLRIE